MKPLLTFFLIFLFTIINLSAQTNPKEAHCGTPRFKPPPTGYMAANQVLFPNADTTTLYIPVTINIVGTNNGGGYYPAENALNAICQLNENFSEYNFHFYIEGCINYIKNSAFYVMNQNITSYSQAEFDFLAEHNTENTLNIYITQSTTYGGYLAGDCILFDNATYPPTILNAQRQAIVTQKNILNYSSKHLTHEVGHYFGLWHTFVGWEGKNYLDLFPPQPVPEQPAPYSLTSTWNCPTNDTTVVEFFDIVEKKDGSNCEIAADFICDTDPDYLSFNWNCNTADLSPYNQKDPNGELFKSDGTLYMSYSDCGDRFSPMQVDWMRDVVDSARGYLLYDQSPPPQITAEDLMMTDPLNSDTVGVIDSITLSWEMPSVDFFLLEFGRKSNGAYDPILSDVEVKENTYDVEVDVYQDYYWIIRGVSGYYPCETWQDTSCFFTVPFVGVEELTSHQALRLYPNPATNKLYLHYTGAISNQLLEITLFDVQGRFVKKLQTEIGQAIDIEDLPNNLYLLKAVIGDKIYTGKFLKQ